MASKWTTPGIVFREVDNSVLANAAPGDGRGAIVLNANRGYPNQRVLNTSIDDFYKVYGTPDNVNQYGHFAAANFFGAGSQQLLTVRATMGDEGYAVIQYPYTDASLDEAKIVKDREVLKYTDNELTDNAVIIQTISSASSGALDKMGYKDPVTTGDYKNFAYFASANRAVVQDVFDKINGNDAKSVYVYRNEDAADLKNAPSGTFYHVYSDNTKTKEYSIAFKDKIDGVTMSAWKDVSANFTTDMTGVYYTDLTDTSVTNLYIPAASTMNGVSTWITDLKLRGITDITQANFKWLFTNEASQASAFRDTSAAVASVKLCDWDDLETKSFIVATDTASSGRFATFDASATSGIEYKEFGMTEMFNDLYMGDVTVSACSNYKTEAQYKELASIAEDYGVDASEIANDNYAYIKYTRAQFEDEKVEKLVKVIDDTFKVGNDERFVNKNSNLFAAYMKEGSKDITQVSTYKALNPEQIYKPWQKSDDTEETPVPNLIAMSTTEIMADTTGIWADGFTPSCETEDEPGNGDIETFESLPNQLVIGAIGPGEFGNNIGISIITPEAAKFQPLYNTNAFNWKYKYDDEDKVDNAVAPNDYEKNSENLTWKKVYRINVYVKPTDKTVEYFGQGLDALTSSPVESWYVSNDPTAKDGEGNTLYAPYVINGHSNYIYVSKNSVTNSTTIKGTYAMPKMTWSIYMLEGGTNSKLNNVKEKTAALKLYADRQKADFDILFNVEGIDTFNGKQRYRAHQNKIAEIAAQRGMDIGVIQTTSRDAKTIKLELSEAKGFSFSNGTYVASYAGYDRYYDSYTANWIYLPKSVAGACAMCYCDIYSYPWMAPAGLARGQIQYSTRSNINHNEAEIGQLYSNNINTSKNSKGYGEILWGQKTMLKKETSALNRINVRRLLNYIEKNLEVMLVPYLFQNNTVNTRTSMRTTVDAFLARIQAAEGIIKKSVEVLPDPEDSHIVYVNCRIIPAETIEWICVTLTVDPNTGITAVEA